LKYLKIFDRFHNVLDEIYEFSGLKYTWTLNGLGKTEFSVGLESEKCTPKSFEFRNHIEVWEGEKCIWGGILVARNFQGTKLGVCCFGYLSLFKWRRLRAKTYNTLEYGILLQEMINDVNAIYGTGVNIGTIQAGALKTQRKVEDNDMLLDKIQEYIQDANYDIDVDVNRQFNFYLSKGTVKSQYQLEYGGDADNILLDPGLSQDIQNMTNSVYSSIETDGVSYTFTAQDSTSQDVYGLMEGTFSANSGIVLQSTLDNYTQGELQRRAYPPNSISLKIKDSTLCPYDDIEIGDSIPVSLVPYWSFKDTLRILEMTHNEDDGTRDVVVGQTLYRPQPPQIKIYRK
jgi:hypothetical protein